MAGFYKGASVVITATFAATVGGAMIEPDVVTVSFSYRANNADQVSQEYPMTVVGGKYTYSWDSSVADAGRF